MANVINIKDRSEQKVAVEATLYSEEAIALLFADKHAAELRYVAKWGTWLRYRGTRWEIDETYDIFSLARNLCRQIALTTSGKEAKKIASASGVAAVERLARSDRRIAATIGQWDADPWLLNTPAGVVDLHTGKVRRHKAEDYLTKITAVAPKGTCPRFRKFLKRVFANDAEMIKYIQRVLGYGLTGKTSEHALFFCHGTGANGKGVLFNTARGIWGGYHQTAALTTFTAAKNEQHPTELAMLRGARLVTCTETEEGARWAETKIKTLTGGDAIQARFMRQDFFEVIPAFKLMISGNHKPALRSVNEAMRRRMNLLPFAVTIPEAERDLNLAEKLEKEWPGILAWAIKGCVLWQKHGLNPPPAVIAATEEYFADEDTFGRFLGETCELGANYTISSDLLFHKWKEWAANNNAWAGSSKTFYTWMAEHKFEKARVNNERVFRGLRQQELAPQVRRAQLFMDCEQGGTRRYFAYTSDYRQGWQMLAEEFSTMPCGSAFYGHTPNAAATPKPCRMLCLLAG
jgi:putative DNA primase/helicase